MEEGVGLRAGRSAAAVEEVRRCKGSAFSRTVEERPVCARAVGSVRVVEAGDVTGDRGMLPALVMDLPPGVEQRFQSGFWSHFSILYALQWGGREGLGDDAKPRPVE
jgi:hypothetical protein